MRDQAWLGPPNLSGPPEKLSAILGLEAARIHAHFRTPAISSSLTYSCDSERMDMSAHWQRRLAVAALLWGTSHVALADGVTIGGDLNINLGNFVFCDSQQTGPTGTSTQCTLEASRIIIDSSGHSIPATIGTNLTGAISAPSCQTRSHPRLRNRLFGTHVVGCKP